MYCVYEFDNKYINTNTCINYGCGLQQTIRVESMFSNAFELNSEISTFVNHSRCVAIIVTVHYYLPSSENRQQVSWLCYSSNCKKPHATHDLISNCCTVSMLLHNNALCLQINAFPIFHTQQTRESCCNRRNFYRETYCGSICLHFFSFFLFCVLKHTCSETKSATRCTK